MLTIQLYELMRIWTCFISRRT